MEPREEKAIKMLKKLLGYARMLGNAGPREKRKNGWEKWNRVGRRQSKCLRS
jgi:hypothetical protein